MSKINIKKNLMSAKYSFRGSPSSDLSVENLWSRTSNIAPVVNPTPTPTPTPTIPTPLLSKFTTANFREGQFGTSDVNSRFSKSIVLPVKINWCWVTLEGHSGTFALEANVSGAPFVGGASPLPFTCFVTENYQDAVRANVTTTPVTPEQDPLLTPLTTVSYSSSAIIGQTYTGLGDLSESVVGGSLRDPLNDPLNRGWLFGVYNGLTSADSVVLNGGGNKEFYTESIYLDNSGLVSVLVFNFKVNSVNTIGGNVFFSLNEKIWVYYN